MTEIDVPDWVVEIAAKAMADSIGHGMTEKCEKHVFAAITAALGAWVVKQHQCMCADEDELPNGPRDIWMDVSEDAFKNLTQRNDVRGRTILTMRQEKPE